MREKDNKKMLKNKNGITLIALIITIIVMLILVAVTITVAVNGGLFGYARNASVKTNEAMENEQLWASGDVIDYYLNRKSAVVGLTKYEDAKKDPTTGVLTTENASYESGMAIAPIPKGFKVSENKEEQSIANGLVIKDAIGNEFVWVPVPEGTFIRTMFYNNMTFEEIAASDDETLRENFYTNYKSEDNRLKNNSTYTAAIEANTDIENWSDIVEIVKTKLMTGYSESQENDPTGKYNNMVTSVEKYGGFYIGRYEAGEKENDEIVVQRDKKPYTNIKWGDDMESVGTGGAVYQCSQMYTGNGYGVTSTLCYGVQWDATLKFIKDKVNVTDSKTWGNYSNNGWTITRENAKYFKNNDWTSAEGEKQSEVGSVKLTTGASDNFKAKNIFDLAGNVWEWTMEAYSTSNRVVRGGIYGGDGSFIPASYRISSYPINSDDYIGFRVSLYIK